MATKSQVIKRASDLGISIEFDPDLIKMDCPQGYIFSGSRVHYLDYDNHVGQWRMPDLYDTLLDEMKMGIEKCDVSDCEVCNEHFEKSINIEEEIMTEKELRELIVEEISSTLSILEESEDRSYSDIWRKMKGEFLSIFSKEKLISSVKKWCDRFGTDCEEYLAMIDDPEMIDSAHGISKSLSPVTESFGFKKAALYPFLALIIFSAISSDSAHAENIGSKTDKIEMSVGGEKELTEAQAKKIFEKGKYVTREQMMKIRNNEVSYVLLLNYYDPEKYSLPEEYQLNEHNAQHWISSIVNRYRNGTRMFLAFTAMSCPEIAEELFGKKAEREADIVEGYNKCIAAMRERNPKFQPVIE